MLSRLAFAALASFLVACGVQAHPTASLPSISESGGATAIGSGGANGVGSGGATGAGTGGDNTGSGGDAVGTGGASTSGSGGAAAPTATGGTTPGSGGRPGSGGSVGTGGAPTSGVGVTINGTFVPKEKAVAFIHFGHSNMRGWATRPTTLRSYFFDPAPGLWSYKGTFTAAKEPTAPEPNQTQAGPGMAILRAAQAALQPGSDVQFISIGYAKGSVTTVDYAKAGTYYPIFMNWANQLKGKVTFGAIVIMLGITDGEHLPSAQVPDFPKRVAQLVSNIRTDLGEPNLPVLFCDYEMNAADDLAPTGPVGTVMIPLIRSLPTMVSKLAIVPTDGITMQDDHHFDMQGHKDWGTRVVMLMQSNSWFPWK
jgi:hypothetical protein